MNEENKSKQSFRMWTKEEEQILRDYGQTMGPKELSKILNRSIGSIRKVAAEKGIKILSDQKITWTPEKLEILKREYPEKGPTALAPMLNLKPHDLSAKAYELGIKFLPPSKSVWSDEEIEILKREYPTHTFREVYSMLENKTYQQISDKIKELQIKKACEYARIRPWTDDDIETLKERYPTEGDSIDLREYLNRTKKAIQEKVKELNLHYSSRPIKNYRTPWTDIELEYLRTNGPVKRLPELVEGLNRGQKSIAKKMKELDIRYMGARFWTVEEEEILKNEYPSHTVREMGKILKKNYEIVRKKIVELGIKKPSTKKVIWTDEMIRKLYC